MNKDQRDDCDAPGAADGAGVCACEGAEAPDRAPEPNAERPADPGAAVVLSSDRFVHRPPPRRRDGAVVLPFQAVRRKV
jgi:hypothetical protein